MSKVISGIKVVSNTSLQQVIGTDYSVLLGAYTFDDSTVKVNDTSGYFRNGTIIGTLTVDPSNSDGSITRTNVLDFTNNVAGGPSYYNLDAYGARYSELGGDISFAFWFRQADLDADWHAIISFRNTSSNTLLIESNSIGKLRVSYNLGASSQFLYDSTTTIEDNTWYHIAIVFTSSSNAMYINGVQDTGSYASGNSSIGYQLDAFSIVNIYIGNFTGAPNILEGYLDDLYIFNKALTLNDIELLYTDTFTGIKQDLNLQDTCISNNVVTQSIYANAFNFNPTGISPLHAITAPDSNTLDFVANGSNRMQISNTQYQAFVPLQVATGSTGSPSYSFVGDTDTGITGNGANEISLVSGGYTTMRASNTGTSFYPVSNIHEIEFGTASGDNAIIFNRSELSNRSRFNIRNTANATTTARYMAFGYEGQNEIRMYYNGTMWVRGDGDAGAPPAYATDGNGGNGTRVVLFPSSSGSSVYGLGMNNTEMWYSVPASATHKFYFGVSTVSFEISNIVRFSASGNSSYTVEYNTPSGFTGLILNVNQTGNYSRFDMSNTNNATATSRYFEMGFNNSVNKRMRIYNNNAFTPSVNGVMSLGTASKKWRHLFGTAMVLNSPPYVIGVSNAQQNVSSGIQTGIVYGSRTTGNSDSPTYSGSTFTIQKNGLYVITYSMAGAVITPAVLGLQEAYIKVNGVDRYSQKLLSQNVYFAYSSGHTVFLSSSDTVQIIVYQTTGDTLLMGAGGNRVFIGQIA